METSTKDLVHVEIEPDMHFNLPWFAELNIWVDYNAWKLQGQGIHI